MRRTPLRVGRGLADRYLTIVDAIASRIGFTPTGEITDTDVQAAIASLDARATVVKTTTDRAQAGMLR